MNPRWKAKWKVLPSNRALVLIASSRRGATSADGARGNPGRWPWQAVCVSPPLRFDPIEEAGRQWRRHWGAAPSVPMMAVTSVMRVQQIWLARLNATLAPFELTFARY